MKTILKIFELVLAIAIIILGMFMIFFIKGLLTFIGLIVVLSGAGIISENVRLIMDKFNL